MKCSGSMTFWCGSGSSDPCLWFIDPDSGPDPAFFVIDLQDANKKLILKIFLLIEDTFTSFFKDKKKSKRSHKTVESRFILLLLLNDRRIRIRSRIGCIPRLRIREAQKHVDPMDPDPVDLDPDPEHCFLLIK